VTRFALRLVSDPATQRDSDHMLRHLRSPLTALAAITLAAVLACAASAWSSPPTPRAQSAATCATYPNQAAAQRAADTRDSDGDGIYCEDLPCPCAGPVQTGGGGEPSSPGPTRQRCTKPSGVQSITFSKTKYPHIRAHFRAALRRGWPRILVLNRSGADERRERLLRDIPTEPGYDRDEYPPAVGRGTGKGLERGNYPRGWKADVRYVDSHENKSHGSVLGIKLRRFCDGTRFRYVFY
jgi:hypothetical protein